MISPCKTLLLDFLQDDLVWWARYLKTDIRILRKLQDGTGTIHLKTAMKIMERIDKETWEKNDIENYFILSELKGYEKERKVIYEESENLFTKDDWISIVRYIIEKRWDAFSLSDILLFIFILALIGIIIYSLFS
jgi:hypothetical protein